MGLGGISTCELCVVYFWAYRSCSSVRLDYLAERADVRMTPEE